MPKKKGESGDDNDEADQDLFADDKTIDDKETQEILDEMRKDGDLPESDKKDEDEGADPADKSKKEPDKTESDKTDDNDVDADKKDKGGKSKEGDEGVDTTNKDRKVNRTPKMIPIKKFHDTIEQKVAEATAKQQEVIDDLTKKLEAAGKGGKATTDSLTDEIKALTELYDVPAELVDGIVKLAIKQAGPAITPELEKRLAAIDQLRESEESRQQDAFFEKEYAELIKESPEADTAEVKARLHDLAFSDGLSTTPLDMIFNGSKEFRALKPIPGKKSAENSRSVRTPGKKAFDKELSEEELDDLTDEEFDEYSEAMAKNFGGKITRNGRPIN